MKRFILRLLIPSVMLLSGCRCQQVTSTATANHTATQVQRDSIYLHDSIFVRIRADTVYLEKWHTRWRDRETVRTDTVQVESIRIETKEIRYVPRFYKYCAALAIILFLIFLLRVTLYLYRRFR